MAAEQRDILKRPAPKQPPWRTARRIGIHTSTAGGVETAAERAYRLGCSCFQVFSSSPRQWKPYALGEQQCEVMTRLRQQYDLKPLVIHANYLINLAAANEGFYRQSIAAFRGEVERALALCAEFLVVHPGSHRGMTRAAGLQRAAEAIERAVEGLDVRSRGLTVLIENTAGSEFSLGGSFEQVIELLNELRAHVPVAACIDTCHTHVAGYDIISDEGYAITMEFLDRTVGLPNVPVWHCNDAKAARGSRLDRHQHVGKGTIGLPLFRRLLNDPRTAHAAFIAETPIDEPGDDARNVETLKRLVAAPATRSQGKSKSSTQRKMKVAPGSRKGNAE
jgi:deoxyribonuclease-4